MQQNKNLAVTVRAVMSTLDLVEVKGRENLDRLLGSINALDAVVTALETAKDHGEAEDG